MSKRWLRGPTINTPGTTNAAVDHIPYGILMYNFIVRILGWTHVDEVCAVSGTARSFTGFTANGVNGVVTGADYTFTDATAGAFLAGHVGMFIVLVDPANPENSGIYQIVTYVSANQVTLNFYFPGGTFPTAGGSCSWWLINTNNSSSTYVPVTNDDYFVFRSPHALYPFEVKAVYGDPNDAGNYSGLIFNCSPETGSWNVGAHDWNAGARVFTSRQNRWIGRYWTNAPHSRLYAVGDTDGSFLFGWTDHCSLGTLYSGMMIVLLEPIESTPTRTAFERLLSTGQLWTAGGGNISRYANDYSIQAGSIWSAAGNSQHYARLVGYYEDGGVEYFGRNIGVNARTSERDALPMIYCMDTIQPTLYFSPDGKVPSNHAVISTAIAIGDMTLFASNNWLHLRDGITLPWNGKGQA